MLVDGGGVVLVDLVLDSLVGFDVLAGLEGGGEVAGVAELVAGTESEVDGVALETLGTVSVVVLGFPSVGDLAVVSVVASSGEPVLLGVETEPVETSVVHVVDGLTEELGEVLGVVLGGNTNVEFVLNLHVELGLEGPFLLVVVLKAELNTKLVSQIKSIIKAGRPLSKLHLKAVPLSGL